MYVRNRNTKMQIYAKGKKNQKHQNSRKYSVKTPQKRVSHLLMRLSSTLGAEVEEVCKIKTFPHVVSRSDVQRRKQVVEGFIWTERERNIGAFSAFF